MSIHPDLACGALSLEYNFATHSGILRMPEGHCCDMHGCIALFTGIDARVDRIDTFSGEQPDTTYRLQLRVWSANADGDHRLIIGDT